MGLLLAALVAFNFPADQAGKLAEAQLLPRTDPGGSSLGVPPGQRPYSKPAFLLPDVPLSKYAEPSPRASFPVAAPVMRPASLVVEVPLAGYRADTVRPETMQFASGPLIRLQSVDVDAVIPLPTLARPKIERAALTDPTLAASVQAALMQPIPVRVTPEAFTPVNLPRPFEHRETVRLRQVPAEDGTPVVAAPRRPS